MKKVIMTGLALCLLVALGGCNTVGGLGDDLKAAGGAITETAAKAKEKISN
jgi:predicted small secreted protein